MREILTTRAAEAGYDPAQKWYHGTDAEFNVFDGSKTQGGNGLHWFTNFRTAAQSFTKAWRDDTATTSRVIDAYVNRGKTLDLNTPEGVKLLEDLVSR